MEKIKELWLNFFQADRKADDWWNRKKALCKKQHTDIVQIKGNGQVFQRLKYDNETQYQYAMHFSFLMKQDEHFYKEEQVVPYQFSLKNGEIYDHKEVSLFSQPRPEQSIKPDEIRGNSNQRFSYDRLAAVRYAERWWDSYNPEYRTFDVDCTNYISQCLYAGGAPMRGALVRDQGWWYQGDNWSFSWAVAHSLRWYLSGSTQGLQGKEVDNPEALIPGDVICYDFQGDGRWDHNTIVVAKDINGMPLVNAHTNNSRNRYWTYEDSAAWTPNIEYKFFRIGE